MICIESNSICYETQITLALRILMSLYSKNLVNYEDACETASIGARTLYTLAMGRRCDREKVLTRVNCVYTKIPTGAPSSLPIADASLRVRVFDRRRFGHSSRFVLKLWTVPGPRRSLIFCSHRWNRFGHESSIPIE